MIIIPPTMQKKKLRTPTLSMRYFMKKLFRRVRSLFYFGSFTRKKKNITHGIKGKSINEMDG